MSQVSRPIAAMPSAKRPFVKNAELVVSTKGAMCEDVDRDVN
jgi:hypothetical protein